MFKLTIPTWYITDLCTFWSNQAVYQMLWKVTCEMVILTGQQLKQVAYSQDKEVLFKISVW